MREEKSMEGRIKGMKEGKKEERKGRLTEGRKEGSINKTHKEKGGVKKPRKTEKRKGQNIIDRMQKTKRKLIHK